MHFVLAATVEGMFEGIYSFLMQGIFVLALVICIVRSLVRPPDGGWRGASRFLALLAVVSFSTAIWALNANSEHPAEISLQFLRHAVVAPIGFVLYLAVIQIAWVVRK